MVWVLFLGSISAGGTGAKKEEPVQNPHGEPASCTSCHMAAAGGRPTLLFDGNVSRLCQSCHDGRSAAREAHPGDMAPSAAIAGRIPPDFPLEGGMLTCCTCHDVTQNCNAGRRSAPPNPNFLRGPDVSRPLEFCFHCHVREKYETFNAHDQLRAGKAKTDVCVWCHVGTPDVGSGLKEAASYALRSKSFNVCSNCHTVPKGHPLGGKHMNATPPAQMMWYMSAYEMQPRMRLPLKRLLEYVRAAKRTPRSIPLDENGRITCYSCHNPHEKGLLPNWNPRSIGAEPKQAANHRFRARGGNVCVACHQK